IYVVWKGNLTINGNALFEGNHAGNKGGAIYATTAGSKVKISATETAQPMFLKNTAGGNGGAIYCYTDVDADIDYAIFRENTSASTTYGGGAFYSSGANVSLKNVLFDGNTSDFNGGAIALYSSSEATFENVNFLRNGADNLGGALYINKSTLGLKNIFAENNAALRGGAFYCTSGAEVISTEGQVTFESNTAIERGGAVYLSKSTFDIKDLYVAYNKAGMDEATRVEDQSFGGAFGVYTTSTVTIGSLTAESNTSYDKGGVMYISGSTVTVNGGEVFGNASANANGGAFSVHSDGALTLNDVSVHDNTAKKNGGAIYVNAATLNGAGSIFAANKCGATDQGGGAMYLTDATVKMSNLTLNGNESPNNGGAIYTAEGSNVTLTGVNAYGNTAGKTGGFAYVEAATMTVQAATDFAATINQNTAADNGGAFAVYERGTLKLYDVECSENVATVGNGGAVFAYGSDLVLGDETNTATIVMNNNTAGKYGGAIAVMEIAKDEEAGIPEAIPASATIHTLELQENHSAKYGGAMYLNDAVVTVTGSLDLYANSADSRGGAVYTTATVFTAADVSADANTCGLNEETRGDGFGGAFCIYSKSEITIATLTASGNTSYEKGGFMYISGSTVVIENGEIEDNTSETANGGGFSVHSGGTVKLYGVTMSGNSAENGNGGALYVYGANAVVGDAEHTDVNAFTGNKAKDGAAIYVSGKTANASLSAHTIVANENVSTGGGAALYVTSDDAGANTTTVSITSLTANKNTATGNGGALYVYNYANVVIDTLNASENSTAGTYGGGVIYASGVSKLEIKNVTATKNTATEKGGFLYLTKTGTVVTIHSGSVSDNTSSASTHATIWSNSQGAKLEINLSAFTYPDGSITGKDNFAITDITPAEANA
ncbi:MAG: hypothetical protein IKA76_09185, partial [Clostridia bacterium]|nr:hypothetical protein [Clostridia bacterium]